MAALNFPGSAVYYTEIAAKDNIAPFEVIPWILSQCRNIGEARRVLDRINIVRVDFSDSFPVTPLHWMIADKENAFVVESVADGVKIYDNTIGIMTNAPDFQAQMARLEESRGKNILGDGSSTSRFIRASYAKENTLPENDKSLAISRFFHIMSTVSLPCGYSRGIDDKPMKTLYTSCIDTEDMTYYFTTYACRQIRGVKLTEQSASHSCLSNFPTNQSEKIYYLS
jgi:choloylglycine hydrolase